MSRHIRMQHRLLLTWYKIIYSESCIVRAICSIYYDYQMCMIVRTIWSVWKKPRNILLLTIYHHNQPLSHKTQHNAFYMHKKWISLIEHWTLFKTENVVQLSRICNICIYGDNGQLRIWSTQSFILHTHCVMFVWWL